MSWRIERRANVDEEIDAVADFLFGTSGSFDLSTRFYQQATDSRNELAENPFLAQKGHISGWPEFRFWRVDGFKDYVYVYRVVGDVIDVAHFVHLARDLPRVLREEL